MIKVCRSMPAPESLETESKKTSGKYNLPDVTEKLEHDFHNKCYICEIFPNADPEVEHLRPHKNGKYPERKFDWNNLFWVCRHCNSIKTKQEYDEGIIDCCRQDPEEKIHQYYDGSKLLFEPLDDDESTIKTCKLLSDTFYEKNTGIRTSASSTRCRGAIEQINILLDTLEEYKTDPQNKMIQDRLRVLLSRESKYACFKRSYVRDHKNELPLLQKYLN